MCDTHAALFCSCCITLILDALTVGTTRQRWRMLPYLGSASVSRPPTTDSFRASVHRVARGNASFMSAEYARVEVRQNVRCVMGNNAYSCNTMAVVGQRDPMLLFIGTRLLANFV